MLLAASIIGGVTSIWAAPVAAAILVVGPEQTVAFQEYSVLAYGIVLMLTGVGLAGGLAGLAGGLVARVAGRRAAPASPSPVAVTGSPAAAQTAKLAIAGERLTTSDVAKRFGGVDALKGVDFCAEPGSITAIIGANGAGKTTLLNAISGHVPLDRGHVRLGDRGISELRPEQIAQAGVARTFQTPDVPESLTVLDVAASSRISERWVPAPAIALRVPRYLRVHRDDIARARTALAFVGLDGMAEMPAHELPLGLRRMLEVARSIAAEPSLVLLDEPAAGLDPDALEHLRDVLVRMREGGATVVLIEHNVTFVMDVADSVYVMDLGTVIASGPPEEVRRDAQVIASYLGRRAATHHTLDDAGAVEIPDVR